MLSGLIGSLRVVVVLLHMRRSDYKHRLADMVKHDHAVIEAERHIGQLPIIFRGIGQMLDVADDIVPGISHSTARERWQFENELLGPGAAVRAIAATDRATW